MNENAIAKLLKDRGFLASDIYSEGEFLEAVLAYQRFHGLKDDGIVGHVTERSLTAFRFCGLPDVLEARADVAKWNKRHLKWCIAGRIPGLDDPAIIAAFEAAFDAWQAVCGITHERLKVREGCDIIVTVGRIDGASGTLAWSELPNGSDRTLTQKYDDGEPWGVGHPAPNGRIDLVRVACHELGHALGLPHLSRGNLLQPLYDQSIARPQAGDIAEVVERYGEPERPPVDGEVVEIPVPIELLRGNPVTVRFVER